MTDFWWPTWNYLFLFYSLTLTFPFAPKSNGWLRLEDLWLVIIFSCCLNSIYLIFLFKNHSTIYWWGNSPGWIVFYSFSLKRRCFHIKIFRKCESLQDFQSYISWFLKTAVFVKKSQIFLTIFANFGKNGYKSTTLQ